MSPGKIFRRAAFAIPALAYLLFSLRMAYLFFVEKNLEAIGVLGLFSLPSSLFVKFLQGNADSSVWNRNITIEFISIVAFGLLQYLLLGVLVRWTVMRRLKA